MIPILFDHDERDFTSQGICRLFDAVSCVVTEERNGIYELELKYPIDGLNFEEIYEGRLIGVTHDDNGDIQPFEIYKISAPLEGIVTFYAHHLSYRLRNLILTPFHASSCAQAMAQMAPKSMTRCPFSFWTDVGETGNFDVNYPVSIKEMLAGRDDSILNTYGPGEFEFDKWTVKFHEDRGVDHGVEIRYGKNLTAITREYDNSETYTAVVPYWYKEDDDGTKHLVTLDDYGVIVSDSDAIQHVYWTDEHGEIIRNEQGYPIEFDSANMVYAPLDLSSEFDEQPTQAELATAAKQLFDAAAPWVPEDSIKISFVALWQTPEYEDYAPLEKVSLCDYVRVIHTKIGVYTLAKVTKTVYNVLLDRYNSIELGVAAESYADRIMGDTKTTLEHIQHQLQRTATADYVNEQIASATDAITGGLGGYIKVTLNANNEPQEILVMDSPSVNTAVNVIRINQAGIGFSTNGYQGPFNSAWLINGTFDAQVINVINLAATVIRTGYLTDVNGYNYWNLETGEFRLATTAYLDTYSENGYTATRAYAVGDMIEVKTPNDTLIYEVTQAIPVGGTITPGTNVQAATAHTLLDFARKAETVTDVDVEYASHTSSITPPPSDSPLWQITSPAWELGKYIWQRTKMVDGNGTSNYSDPVCIQGAQGTNTAVVYLYKRSASAATIDWTTDLVYSFSTNALTSTPSGWSESVPVGDDPLYMTAATASSRDATDTILYTEWATPVIVAQNGEDGADAAKTAVVTLYKRSNTTPTKPSSTLTYTFATAVLSGSLDGWSQTIPAADGNPCYSIQAVAIGTGDTDTIPSTEWSPAVAILSDGLDGRNTAMIYLYKRATTAPTVDWRTTLTYTFASNSLSSVPSGWSRDIPSGDNPLYVTAATASSTEDTDEIAYTEWSTPVMMAKNGEQGSPGADGKNNATVRLYKRASSAPSIDWQTTLTYDFTTNALTSVPSGWSLSVPDGDDDLYATAATASSTGSTDTIAANEWATPVCITKNGLSWSTAAVFLYARASSASALTKPTQSLDYTFSTGILSRGGQTGPTVLGQWSQEIPATDGNPCFVIQATAVSNDGQTDTIAASEWSDIAKLVVDGEDGTNGSNGQNTAVIYLYKRSATAATINWQTTLTYTFATNSLDSIPSGWSRDIPSGTDPLYVTAATASSTGATDSIPYNEWTTPVMMAKNGENGAPGSNGSDGRNTAVIYLYKRSATAATIDWTSTLTYTFATNSLNSVPSGWSRDIPSGDNPLYVTAATASSTTATDTIAYTEWSTPVIMAKNGEDGAAAEAGLNSATVFLYARAASASALTKPSSNLTYTFATGVLASIPSPWSQSIPATDGNPCFVIQATAVNREATDTILSTEWSNIVEFVSDGSNGTNGVDGLNSATIFLYARAASASALTKPTATLTYNFSTKALTPSSGYTGWSQTIPDSNANGDPCFVIQATAVASTATDTIAKTEWSAIAKLVQDGEDGANGTNGTDGRNTAMVYLYKRSSSAPSIDWTSTLTYTFSTNSLSSTPSGWSRSIPSGSDPLYVTAATASSTTDTDTIAYTEWSTPVMLAQNGQNGSNGTNGTNGSDGLNSATVRLYARAASASALTKPSSNLTYTFATGVLASIPSPWSQTIPESNGNPCFTIQATAISATATDTILSTEWSNIVEFVADGSNGSDGLNSATVFLYARAASASALTKPTATLTYNFSTKALTPSSGYSGWSQTIPDSNANGDPCFVIQATAVASTATDTIATSEWSSIAKLVKDGEDGAAGRSISSITEYYARSKSNSTEPSSWQTTVPTLTATYKYLWNYEVIAYSDNSTPYESAKRVIGVYGNTGAAGTGISSITNHYLATASGSGVTTSTPGWVTDPTQAVLTPTNKYLWNYETIAYSDSSSDDTSPAIIGVYGETGKGISAIVEQYALGDNASTAPTSGWSATQPAWQQGHYIWTRSEITWSDSSITYTTPICANAINGANEAVQNLDDSLTQDEVFSRLTNGFNTEGIFLENGRLFVNSTGIATGFIHDKATVGGTNVEFYNEKNNIASRDYVTGDYITHDSYACQAKKNIYAHEWINNSTSYTTNVTRLGTAYGESSSVATRDYAVNDYIVFGGKLYRATAAISTGATISTSVNCTLIGTCYIQTSYYATQAYSSGAYIKSASNLYQATTSIASGDMIFPGANVNYLSLGSMYHNYWNLNTGQFVTARGLIAGFNIGESTYNGSSWSSLFYMSAMRDNVYNWGYPYSAVNTPVQGVGLRGSSDSVNLGFNIISQGRMYVNNANTNYAGRIRMSAGMLYFDLGLSPTSVNSSWTTAAYINPWSGTGGTGLNINGNLAVTGNFAASGSKSRLIETDGYGKRLLYSYETPSPMFGDVGEGEIGNDGLCYIWLEPIFAQSINEGQYQVFLQKYGEGDCYISERNSKYFVVKGTIGLMFGWELKAKQKEYTMTRLGVFDDTPVSGSGADNLIERTEEYLQNLREGRVTQ